MNRITIILRGIIEQEKDCYKLLRRLHSYCSTALLLCCSTAALLLYCSIILQIESARAEDAVSLTLEISKLDKASLFSMEFKDADLKDILRAIGQENNMNIIISDNINGKLTLSFQNVTLMDAFRSILRINNLTYFQEGNIVRVIKSPFLDGERDLITRIIHVNYADAEEISDVITNLLSKKGNISVNARTNSIIIKDLTENVDKITDIIEELDTRTPQILIEARIVEVNTNFTRELGIQWGGNFLKKTSKGSYQVTGGVTQISSGSTPIPQTKSVGLSGNNLVVNLPANVGQGRGGSIGMSFGSILNTFQLDLQLSAMEDTGKGKILSNPKILTLDNKEAKISTGTEILIPTTSLAVGTVATGNTGGAAGAAGQQTNTGVTTIDAKLELTVIPHVTSDNHISLYVKTDKKDPDFNRQVQDIPPLTTRTAETNLLIKNGETIVIGGIYTKNEASGESGIPWLYKLPFIGRLFKKETNISNQAELLIFITPTIIEDNS
ncbi:MAG: type IV pilus secretin PilQ [Nitrospirota bacterium]